MFARVTADGREIEPMKARGCRCLSAQCISFIAKTLHILIVLFAVDAESITAQSQSLQKVRIAYASSGINYADIFLAKEMGFYREEGLEPQFIQMVLQGIEWQRVET